MLELAYHEDPEMALKRMEAWWHQEILDRPCIQLAAPRPADQQRPPLPEKSWPTEKDRWLDIDYLLERVDRRCANTYFPAELLPSFMPNLGPDVLAAGYGCELEFGPSTSWSVPWLHDWADLDQVRFDLQNEYMQAILAMTRRGLEAGQGKFLTGFTDLHPGGDLVAALRDPIQLCEDVALEPEQVHALCAKVRNAFWELYEPQLALFREAGQTVTTTWLPLFHEGKYYVPSNDFSCTISTPMFEEFFLEELVAECDYLDRSIYHLDGPGALRHLDTLLAIPSLDAIQWVFGAGNGPARNWVDVCKKITDAGKNLQIHCGPDDVDTFIEHLPPNQTMLYLGTGSVEEADAILEKISHWRMP